MKYQNFFAMLLALLASIGVFTSCSSDDDEEPGEVLSPAVEVPQGIGTSELGKAANYDNSAKFEANNQYGRYQSVEFTEDGRYIIMMNSYAASVPEQQKKLWTKLCVTRADGYSHQIYGNFVKIGENEYLLEGFGSVVIEGDANNAYSIIITRDGEEPTVIECSRREQIKDTQATQWLCKTWDVNTIHLIFTVNGKVIFNDSAPGTQAKILYSNCIKTFYNWAKANYPVDDDDDDDDKDIKNEEVEELEGIVNVKDITFTRAGSYLFTTPDTDQLAISMWTWEKEEEGLLRYTHNFNNFYDPYYSNNVNVNFKGKEMTLYETKTINEDEDDFALLLKMETIYSCSHK